MHNKFFSYVRKNVLKLSTQNKTEIVIANVVDVTSYLDDYKSRCTN